MYCFRAGRAVPGGYFSNGKGRILLSDVRCLGNESKISDCPQNGYRQHRCSHREDAGVICHNVPQPIPEPIRKFIGGKRRLGTVTRSIQVASRDATTRFKKVASESRLKTDTWARLETRLSFAVLHRLSNRISGIRCNSNTLSNWSFPQDPAHFWISLIEQFSTIQLKSECRENRWRFESK